MWPFDQIARAVSDIAKKVVEVVVDTAKAVGDAVTGMAETVGGAIRGGADLAGSILKGGLDAARGWVNESLGDSWLGAIARGGIDLVRAGVGLAEFGLEVTGSLISLTGQVLGDLLRGDVGAIPGRMAELGRAISDDAADLNRDVGAWVIDKSQIGRPIPGAPRTRASAWSVAASLEPNDFRTPDPRTYKDTGKRYEFELRAGEVFFRECTMTTAEPTWQKLVFRTDDDVGSMIAFDRRRLGDLFVNQSRTPLGVDGPVLPAPEFESICANADRVFAKEAGTDNFYFLLMDELFWGPATLDADDPYDSELLKMPSNYFKIDPDQNRPGARAADLAAGLVGYPLPKIPQSERHPLFEEALKLGLLGTVVKVEPRLWYRIDCRPPLDNSEDPIKVLPPSAPRAGVPIPHYDHVTRRSDTFYGGLQPPQIGRSIDFDDVLDIGVGNSHFHEPWTAIYGGELRNTRIEYFHGLALGELTYSMLNGPLSDGDHYADGTCNFYILARLRGSENYVVLYCDEQTFFTQRWRLAAPADNTPTDITKLNFSVAASLSESRDQEMFAFEPDRFWTPFGRRYLDATSRMAVSRTVVVVSGSDSRTGHAELYSANVGYGVFDRTWRYRDLNAAGFVIGESLGAKADASLPVPALVTKTRRGDVVQDVAPRTVWPQTVRLREDMHLVLTGTSAGAADAVVAGVWTQTYLPADGEVHPSKEQHADGRTVRAGTRPHKPATGFFHPWTFWSESVFALADRFSHLGVYAKVNARTQFYALDILDNAVVGELSGTWRFSDGRRAEGPKPGQLYIKARKLHWQKVGGRFRSLLRLGRRPSFPRSLRSNVDVIRSAFVTVTEELGQDDIIHWENPPHNAAEANEQLRASRRSMYLRDGVFDLRQAGDLGAIATWHDKRDDDLISLSDLPMETTLVSVSDPEVSIRVRFRHQQRVTQPPVVQWARVALVERLGSEGRPDHSVEIRYRTNRTPHQLALQLYSFKLAALNRSTSGNPVSHLLDGEHHRDTRPVEGSPGEWVASVPISAAWIAENDRYLGPEGRLAYGTSLWFTGPTGLVATAEAIEFA